MEGLPSGHSGEFLDPYGSVAGRGIISHLQQLAAPLRGARVVHVNSAREGGGVAEILQKLVPFKQALGLEAEWKVIDGDLPFHQTTRKFHQALQGLPTEMAQEQLELYESTNAANAEALQSCLADADFVFVHNPQPAALIAQFPQRKGKWIWRCHVDAGRPHRPVWEYLRQWLAAYDASVFSLPQFAQPLPHPQYVIAPSIDPLSEKNRELPAAEVQAVDREFGFHPGLPLVLQVSRFDRFKDPLGVIEGFRQARRLVPLQLVLAGGVAGDDPEGEAVLREVRGAAGDDPHLHVLSLPPAAHRTINALQRRADIVVQKSLREGFGLTVSEAMWKGKPVIGGDTGGIRLQVFDHYTGFLVRTPDGLALRIRYLLHRADLRREMGERARRFARENYLITRHLREYFTLMLGLRNGNQERIENVMEWN